MGSNESSDWKRKAISARARGDWAAEREALDWLALVELDYTPEATTAPITDPRNLRAF